MLNKSAILLIAFVATLSLTIGAQAEDKQVAAAASATEHEAHSEGCKLHAKQASASHEVHRRKRQIVGLEQQPGGQNPLSSLSNLGSQFGSLFGGSSSSNQGAAVAQNQGSVPSTSDIMGSLTSLVRSQQESAVKMASDTQHNAAQAGQLGSQAAQNGQAGFIGALTEIGKGLKQITANNPGLIPDVKNLFSNVQSKLQTPSPFQALLSSAGSSSQSIVPATNSQQLSDNLAKVAVPGLQIPAQ